MALIMQIQIAGNFNPTERGAECQTGHQSKGEPLDQSAGINNWSLATDLNHLGLVAVDHRPLANLGDKRGHRLSDVPLLRAPVGKTKRPISHPLDGVDYHITLLLCVGT